MQVRDMVDEVVAIVGGSSGIGKEAARLFIARGARVVLLARGKDRLASTAREIGRQSGQVEVLPTDVGDAEQVREAAERIADRFGKLDALVYGAAVFYLSPAATMDLQQARRSMDINYWGAVHVTRAFLPLIRKGGRKSMVYLSSLSTQCTPPFFAAYAATKHALRGFLLSLRQELRPEGIHVGIVSPGPTATPLIENDLHQNRYRLPPGIPVLTAETAAQAVVKAVLKRRRDVVVPVGIAPAARLAAAFPALVEMYYRLSIPGWNRLILEETKALSEAGD